MVIVRDGEKYIQIYFDTVLKNVFKYKYSI